MASTLMQSNNKAQHSWIPKQVAPAPQGPRQFIKLYFNGNTRNLLRLKIDATGVYNQQVNNYESAEKRKYLKIFTNEKFETVQLLYTEWLELMIPWPRL